MATRTTFHQVTLDLVLSTKVGVLVGTVAESETGSPMDANVDFRSTTDSRRDISAQDGQMPNFAYWFRPTRQC